jgi:plastocyanin
MRVLNDMPNRKMFLAAAGLLLLCCFANSAPVPAQGPANSGASVTGQVEITGKATASGSASEDAANVVVWLTPLDASRALTSAPTTAVGAKLVQRNKMFDPHLLVVVAGTTVEFPNKDPFLHNVFSLFDGKRFDLGFYEAGSSRSVRFDRVGVSFLFCNIHPEMSAVVVAVPTPYYGVSDRTGHVSIANVPSGRYRMQVWSERSLPESLKGMERTVVLTTSDRSLPAIQVAENPSFSSGHKNKFGQDYVPPAGSSY